MSTTAVNVSSTGTGLTMSNPLSGSGIDVDSVVAQIEAGERAPETNLQNQQATIQTQESALTGINTDLSVLLTSVQSLTDPTGALAAEAATSSDTSVLNATATSSAIAGNHTITVSHLATTGSWYSAPLTDSTTATFTPGTLTLTVGGTPTTLTFDSSNDTLSTAASYINGLNVGVTASIVTDSSGSRLALVSNQSGATGDISVAPGNLTFSIDGGTPATVTFNSAQDTPATEASYINGLGLGVTASAVTGSTGTTLSLVDSLTGLASDVSVTSSPAELAFTQGTVGQNAQLTVDGVPVVSASNTVTGAIPGVTLNLAATNVGSPVELSVAPDVSSVTAAVNQFVSSYNQAIGDINAQFTYNTSTQTQGPLATDGTLTSVQSQLLQMMTYSTGGSSSVSSLASLGVTMNNDGTLSVDNTTLSAAATNDSSDLQQFMQGTKGFATTLQSALNTLTAPNTGALTVDITNLQSNYTDLESQITAIETQITSQHDALITQYSTLNALLEDYPTQLQETQVELGLNTSTSS
jgi:flagellar hook-associated protein 2